MPRHLLLLLVFRVIAACAIAAEQGLDKNAMRAFRQAVHQAVWDRVYAGGAWWVECGGSVSSGACGFALKAPEKVRASEDTIFDAASLTKAVATAPCVMRLIEEGRMSLDDSVQAHLSEFTGEGRDAITIRHLLAHTSGLRPGLPRNFQWSGYERGIELACASVPLNPPDKVFRYSDVNFILLGEIVRRVAGVPLDEYARRVLFEPLGMSDSAFNPPKAWQARIAATENDDNGQPLRGVVHDPTARRMGGVAGHAGLFTTTRDLARYARCLLNGGELDGRRILQTDTVRVMTTVATPADMKDRRALGWDVSTSYSRPRGGFPEGSTFGHTGFTGCCLWIDPGTRSFYVFLGSRLHETDRDQDSRLLYEVLGRHAARAAGYP